MFDGGFLQRFVKASQELFPVICDDLADTDRKQPGCTAEKAIDDITVERRHSQRQCIIAVFVDHGSDIATHFTAECFRPMLTVVTGRYTNPAE